LKLEFDALRSNKLFINLEKSEFCGDVLVFYGNVISNGVSMGLEKIKAILEYPTPQRVTNVVANALSRRCHLLLIMK